MGCWGLEGRVQKQWKSRPKIFWASGRWNPGGISRKQIASFRNQPPPAESQCANTSLHTPTRQWLLKSSYLATRSLRRSFRPLKTTRSLSRLAPAYVTSRRPPSPPPSLAPSVSTAGKTPYGLSAMAVAYVLFLLHPTVQLHKQKSDRSSVCPDTERCGPCNRPPLLGRDVSLRDNTPHASCHPAPARLRRRYEEDPPAARTWCSRLRPH